MNGFGCKFREEILDLEIKLHLHFISILAVIIHDFLTPRRNLSIKWKRLKLECWAEMGASKIRTV